jgi:hypothetical protein
MGKPAKFWSALLVSLPAWAVTPAEIKHGAAPLAEIEYLVQQTLAREGALFVSYSIGDSGKVILVFGANEPDWRIQKAVQALQSRPEIPGVTWIKTDTDFCPIR